MKRFDYFDYEKKISIEHLRKLSGAKTVKMGLDLLRMALKILISSIRAEHPRFSPLALHKEVRKFLWPPQ